MKKLKHIFTIILTIIVVYSIADPVQGANLKSATLVYASSQFYSIADGSQTGLNVADDFTFEIYWKLLDRDNNWSIFKKWGAGNASYQIYVSNAAAQTITILIDDDGTPGGDFSNNYTVPLTTGAWDHWAFRNDANDGSGNQLVTIWKDASIVGDATGTTNSIFDNTTDFQLAGGTDGNISGQIDEVRIWNTVKTQAELSANMDVELVGDEAGLVSYWKFTDNAVDEHANSNDLTTNNGPVTYSTDVPFDPFVAASGGGELLNIAATLLQLID